MMDSRVVNDIMKPRRDANGNLVISQDKVNYMKMTVAQMKFQRIHEMALFGVSKAAEDQFNMLIDDVCQLMDTLEEEAIRIARKK